ISARISGVKNFVSSGTSFVRAFPLSHVQSANANGSAFLGFAGSCVPSAAAAAGSASPTAAAEAASPVEVDAASVAAEPELDSAAVVTGVDVDVAITS